MFITMAFCLPLSSTTDDFEYIHTTTLISNQPTKFNEISINTEIPSTTVNLLTTDSELSTETSSRTDLNAETTEPNYLYVFLEQIVSIEDKNENVSDEMASTVLSTETSDNSELFPTSSTKNDREITTIYVIATQETPVKKYTRISKTTRTPYYKRTEIITQKTPRYLTREEMRVKYGSNYKKIITENLFYILCPVVVVTIVMGLYYVKKLTEI